MTDNQQTGTQGDFFASLPRVFADLPPMPKIPSPEELYDAIMAKIEPELTTAQIPLLERKYAGEPAAEKAKREQRYMEAYAKYDAEAKEYFAALNLTLRASQRQAMASVEHRERAKEEERVTQIESSFSDA